MRLSLRAVAFFAVFCGSVLSGSSDAHAGYEKNDIGALVDYTAKYEDTFIHLARRNGLGFVEMRAANPGIDPWIPGAGTKLVIPAHHLLPDAPRKDVVINLPEMRIYAYVNGDKAPLSFPIGVGREGLSTPLGKTTVVRKVEGPVWRPTPRMRKLDPELPEAVYPGPDNPMGTHALYLGWSQYAIHGTNKPYGIGRRSSSGCIRMYPEDVKVFYQRIPVGTQVNVVNQPLKLAWIGNDLYMEAHPDLEQTIKMEESGVIEQQKMSDADMNLILQRAGTFQDYLNWPKIRTAIRERRGYPIVIAHVPESKVNVSAGGDDDLDKKDESGKEAKAPVVRPAQKPEYATTVKVGGGSLDQTITVIPVKKPRIVPRID
ncbi:MAG: L,D-transpeptidase family protein [Alphaproteobacteria bacterium]|nr:L,D-transpeptidase family protein [Alphaproteobacteria bacterium]